MKSYSLNEILFFFQAWLLLHVSKVMILIFPFRKIAAKLGQAQLETPKIDFGKEKWFDVEVAINRASRFTLFKSKCYDQALTGKYMLRKKSIPSTLYFGLAKEKGELIAHAWVRAGKRIVTGRAGMEKFSVVAYFGDVCYV
jgi:hypothetical protein